MNDIIYTAKDYLYKQYESLSNSQYSRRTIDGKTVGSNKCVGYCSYNQHPGFLTKELRKNHNCLKKECNYYFNKIK